ncbi:hypothetical protein SASPL_143621 [Salvia splendens]|uniref:Myb/SANT-like domain-containing protein n=1 Tax=Salvia splendens TaxID=180675 RepID=A0A8X8ZB08_SALSN|nr:hypothetical protein SASPL_143621 [Salvia splendens]
MAPNLVAGSNDVGTAKNVKTDRSRRTWSVREEEILLATMKELVANGWRGDHGYRAGYLTRIREAIMFEFPKTDILPHPHIYSKITTWKKNYGSLMMMLNHSGIGFNSDGKYKIECDDEQWAQFVNMIGRRYSARTVLMVPRRLTSVMQLEESTVLKSTPADDAGTSHHMTLQDLFPDESFPDGVLPEMVDESQSYTKGGVLWLVSGMCLEQVDVGVFQVKRYKGGSGCPPRSDLELVDDEFSDNSYTEDVDTSDDYEPSEWLILPTMTTMRPTQEC